MWQAVESIDANGIVAASHDPARLEIRHLLRGTFRAPLRTRAEGVVWLPDQAILHAGGNGFFQRWLTEPGSRVTRGTPLYVLDDAQLVAEPEVARTPLIISETLPDDLEVAVHQQAIALAANLEARADYVLGRHRDVWLMQAGLERVRELASDLGGVWVSALWCKELAQKALSARLAFHRDRHYIVTENTVRIVDEFTGRVMPDRTWERGLHQMIEAKEGCEITGQRRTLSQITYQRFFRRYLLLA